MTLTIMMIMQMKMMMMIKKKKKIYHLCRLKVRKLTIHVDLKIFNFLVQQHENTKPTKSNTIKNDIIVWLRLNEFLSVKNEYACHTNFYSSKLIENESSGKKLAS